MNTRGEGWAVCMQPSTAEGLGRACSCSSWQGNREGEHWDCSCSGSGGCGGWDGDAIPSACLWAFASCCKNGDPNGSAHEQDAAHCRSGSAQPCYGGSPGVSGSSAPPGADPASGASISAQKQGAKLTHSLPQGSAPVATTSHAAAAETRTVKAAVAAQVSSAQAFCG